MRQFVARAHALTARVLDIVDRLCVLTATLAVLGLAICILLQITARFVEVPVLWASDVAGYALVAATFMAMGPTLRRGVHIRVSLVLNATGERVRGVLDVWSYAVGFAFALYAAWWSAVQVHESWRFGDLSTGLVPFPLWVPQSFMALGFIAFTCAMLEGLLARLAGAPVADRPAAAPEAATPPLERAAE
jgi:TRAP-type C4-dicarboxylate transport system permease small subunit